MFVSYNQVYYNQSITPLPVQGIPVSYQDNG